jgi:GT2 family glycosyltransferase
MADSHVSIVFVNWNARGALLAALASLHAHPPSTEWDAVVVDNASGDGSAAAVAHHFPDVKVILNESNLGLAAANNQGIAATSGQWIVLSNPDVLFTSGAIDALVDTLERHPQGCFAVPRLTYPDGSGQPSAGDLPTIVEALRGRRGRRMNRASASPTHGYWWYGWSHDEERQIGHGAEACYLVRRAAVVHIGDQDERFPLDWEGIEWSRRAQERQWEVWFCPSATIVHEGGVSVRQAQRRWILSSHRGMYRYFAPTLPLPARAVLAAVISARAAVKLAASVADRRIYDRAQVRTGLP